MEFRPAREDTGIVFVRADLASPVYVPARVQHRIDVPRRTAIRHGGATVEMIEHIMAALAGLRIDNCEVWVDAAEMPGCDGSSLAFVEAIQKAGAVEQSRPRRLLAVREPLRVEADGSWIEATPSEKPGLQLCVRLDYGHSSPIGRQTFEAELSARSFTRAMAAARTFLLLHEAQWLRSQGLGKRTTYQDLLIFGDSGPIENQLRFPDECVRHKTLDLVGDLALSNCDIQAAVAAHCSGHELNAEMVRALLTQAGEMEDPVRRSA